MMMTLIIVIVIIIIRSLFLFYPLGNKIMFVSGTYVRRRSAGSQHNKNCFPSR